MAYSLPELIDMMVLERRYAAALLEKPDQSPAALEAALRLYALASQAIPALTDWQDRLYRRLYSAEMVDAETWP